MTPEQFQRAGEIFHAALAVTRDHRPQFVADACGGDDDLRHDVESLLAAHDDAGTFIEWPALEQVASDVATEGDNVRDVIGEQVAHYEISTLIGQGGMGEVYKARDTRLNRPVAIKFLPLYIADESARRRFQQEAKMASALNHPHIVTVHEVGERDGRQYLVTEFVDGGTLADWALAARRSWRQIVDLLVGVGDGLAAAHAAGILHRDIKPSNILVSKSGYAKLADFGLAKLDEHANAQTVSRTASVKTRPGAIIGTIAYMSPEQASGTLLDARSDIFSFGVVVYELLARRRPFDGVTDRDILQSIIHETPQPLDDSIPIELRLLVEKSLEKDPAERYQTMRDVVIDLKRVRRQSNTKDSAPERGGRAAGTAAITRPGWQRWLPFAAGLLVASAIAALVGWKLWPTPDSKSVNRFDYELPLIRGLGHRVMALSPDGRRFVYNAQDGLYVREMDSLEARRIPGTEQALTNPFFSPDGQTVGYWDEATSRLMRISLRGGLPIAICAAENPRGVSWEADDTILFAQANGIHRVQANGGAAELVIPTAGQERFYGPQLLPGGESVLFSVSGNESWAEGAIVVQSLKSGSRKVLMQEASDGRYEPPDRLVFAQRDGLFVARFDPKSLAVVPGLVSLVKGVERPVDNDVTGALAHYSVSAEGTLAYLPRRSFAASLVWVDRQGHEEALNMPPRQYVFPRLSPDGTEVALTIAEGDADVWIWNFARKTLRQVTFDAGVDAAPVWSPDGQRIAYTSEHGEGRANLFWRSADGSGAATRLTTAPKFQIPHAFSKDGSELFFTELGAPVWVGSVSVRSEQEVKTVLKHAAFVDISPNGRWIAYQSGLLGQVEIYVQALADLSGGKYKVSSDGGTLPEWSRDGRELFYLVAPGRVMAVPVEAGERFRSGNPELVVDGPYMSPDTARAYDVSPDGRRFLMIKPVTAAAVTRRLVVIQNWPEELRRAAPANP